MKNCKRILFSHITTNKPLLHARCGRGVHWSDRDEHDMLACDDEITAVCQHYITCTDALSVRPAAAAALRRRQSDDDTASNSDIYSEMASNRLLCTDVREISEVVTL